MKNLLSNFVGSGLKTRLLRPNDELWDFRLGIKTFGHMESGISDGRHYGATAYSVLKKVFEVLQLKEGDVFVDIGCGLARPLLFAANQINLKSAVGIEANAKFADMGRQNLVKLKKKRCPVEIVEAYAQNYDYSQATVIYMYNPFGADTMRLVLDKIQASLGSQPRNLRIAYLNPIENKLLLDCSWLEKYAELSHADIPQLEVGKYIPTSIPAASFFKIKR